MTRPRPSVSLTVRSTRPCRTSRSTRLVTAPDVTIVVPASSVGVSWYGAPARRSEASTSKSPLPRSAWANTGRSSWSSSSATRWMPADDEHRPDVEVGSLARPLLGDAVHGVRLLLGHGLIVSSKEDILVSMEDTSLRTLLDHRGRARSRGGRRTSSPRASCRPTGRCSPPPRGRCRPGWCCSRCAASCRAATGGGRPRCWACATSGCSSRCCSWRPTSCPAAWPPPSRRCRRWP